MVRKDSTPGGGSGGYLADRIDAIAGSLSPSELRVAQLIVERPYDFIEWSAAELARRSGTSGATVVRTCRQLGFGGLRDLRLTLARDLGWPSGRDEGRQPPARRVRSALEELFEDASRSLGGMVTKETASAYRRAVDHLTQARRILVVSAGPTQVFAYDFAVYAQMIGKHADFWHDVIMQNVLAAQLTRRDVCVAASASGVNNLTIEAATTARDAGAKVVAVTGYRQSRLAEIATVTLVADTFDYSTRSQAAINSAGILLMLRALIIGMTEQASAGGEPAGHAVLDAKQVMRRFAYRRTPAQGASGPGGSANGQGAPGA